MKRFTQITLLIFILFPFITCKKKDAVLRSLGVDPIANESFGTKLKVNNDEMIESVVWSQNSVDLFLKITNGTYIMNISSKREERLLTSEHNGTVLQVTPDNEAAIFGLYDNSTSGYYSINLANKQISELVTFGYKQSGMVYVGNNNMFYVKGDVVQVGRPCESWDDFNCGVRTGSKNVKFRHKRFDTNKVIELQSNLIFDSYSYDGSRALLFYSNNSQYICYRYDVTNQTILDSASIPFNYFSLPTFHWNNSNVQYASLDQTTNEIIIRDLISNQEIKRFKSSLFLIDSYLTWPRKSNKIYYKGSPEFESHTYVIYELDLNTMTERQLVTTSYSEQPISPSFSLFPSPDGSVLVFSDGYATYLKEIN